MATEKNPQPKIKVLSLEDSTRDFELIQELLADAGYQTVMDRVETETAFVAALQHKDYDIVLADFNMPEYDAFSALGQTLVLCPEVPFVVVSGAIGEETAIDLIKQGAVDYVLKDRPKRLVSAVARALAEAEQRRARKQAEQALEESNWLFHIAGETARVGGWRVDLATNTCTWSAIVAEIYEMPHGYAPPVEEGIGFYAPEWRDRITRAFTDCAQKGIPYDEEMEIITKNGRRVWVRTLGEPVRNAEGEIVMVQGAFQDISDRKAAEQKMAASEAELRALFANMTDAVIEIDADGKVVKIAPTRTVSLVQPPEDMIGKSMQALMPAALAAYHLQIIKEVLATGEVVTGEYSQTLEGEERWFETHASPLTENSVLWVAHDITERRNAEQALRESEAYIKTVTDNLPIGVAVNTVDPSVEFSYINENFVNIYRTTREKLAGKGGFWEAVYQDPAFREEIRNQVEADCASGDPDKMHWDDIPLTRMGEETTYFSAKNTPVPGQDWMISTVWDTTSRVMAEQALRESERIFHIALMNSPVTVFQQDRDLRYTWIHNPTMGYDHTDEIGKTDGERFAPEDAAILTEIKQRVLDSGVGERHILKFTGEQFPLYTDLTVEPILDANGQVQGITCSSVDITDFKLAEEGQRRRLAELEALANITEILRPARTLDEALPILLSETLDALELPAGCIHIFDPEVKALRMLVAKGWFEKLQLTPIKPGVGITGRVYQSGELYLTEDFASDPQVNPAVSDQIPPGWGGAAIPIMAMDETIGVFFVACQAPQRIDNYRLQLLEALSRIAGITLHRMRLLEAAEKRVSQLQAQRAIDQALIGTTDLSMALNTICAQALNRLPADAVGVLLLSPHDQSLACASGVGFKTKLYQRSRCKLGDGYAGRAALEQQAVQLDDLKGLNPPFGRAELADAEALSCYSGIPLVSKGQVKGVLEIFHTNHFDHTEEWHENASSLAAQISVAVDSLQIYNHLQRSNLELSRAYDATIEGWSLALDLRDSVTEGHSLRVTDMTMALAKELGIGEAELVHVRRGALLHDMGKLGVPDSILLKPGALTDEEWAIMKQHPRLAYDMLSAIGYLRPALDIPYYHHEKWDGSGYPSGFKGRQIPLAARIFAVIDVYDALTSDRPYRDAWPEEKALDHIRSQSGTHFDPEVVEAFMRFLDIFVTRG